MAILAANVENRHRCLISRSQFYTELTFRERFKLSEHTQFNVIVLGARPSRMEEEEGLVKLHTYKFEVHGISAG